VTSEFRFRLATADDAPAVAALVNLAYRVEDFFKIGDRTDEAEVAALIAEQQFIVAEIGTGGIAGCVLVEARAPRGHFGMLAAGPAIQRRGLGRQLIREAEAFCAARGCTEMELELVNLRLELPAYYRSLGYEIVRTEPFSMPERASRPCHFIVMSRPITPIAASTKEFAR
jgi:ribosomal protein S18 acetylase RimI-like enzyme